LNRNKSTSVIKFPQRHTKHVQSAHTAGQAQFVEGTFVLTKERCNTAVVPAGIFGDGEQPSADGELQKAGRKEQPNTQGSDGLADCLGWLAPNSLNLQHTCLVSRRLQRGRAR